MLKRVYLYILLVVCVLNINGCSTLGKKETVLDQKVHINKGMIWNIPEYPRVCDSLKLEKKMVDIGDGCKLYVETEGKGTPIVLINGGPGSDHYEFHPYFSEASKFAEVIYYDQRGCGLSDHNKGKAGRYSFGQAIDDLEKLRKALGIKKWVLLGHSYGGFLAQAYTLKYPQNVKGLILVCALTGMKKLNLKPNRNSEYITKQEENKFIDIELAVRDKVINGDLTKGKGKEIQIYNKALNGEWKQQNFYKPSKREMAEYALYGWKPDKDFRGEMFSSMEHYDLINTFLKCPIPTLLIEGKWDLTWDTDKPEKFYKQHPGSEHLVFEKSGHAPCKAEQKKFFKVIKKFVSNLPNVSSKQIKSWQDNLPIYIDEEAVISPKKIWKEFTTYIKENKTMDDKIRPFIPSLKKPLEGFIEILENKVPKDQWNKKPEIYQFDNKVLFITELTENGIKSNYCFIFFVKNNHWYFQHLETITLRLDKIKSLPTSKFPDISLGQKNWIRNEQFWTEQIRLFRYLSKKEGKEFAFNWFKDGDSYILSAKTWIPFLPPYKAFILYLCWEQSNLWGNKVTLESLNNHKSIVKISKPIYFSLYYQTAHFSQQIDFDDYLKIFKSIWCDRALKAGWKLKIDYKRSNNELILTYTR